ncbi:MAG: type IV pili twitching motility protein PilT, partial [Gaiellaceae bacterium]
MDIDNLLAHAVSLGASDIHLKIDRPPIVRLDGALVPLTGSMPLGSHDLERVLRHVTQQVPHRFESFREHGELDIAYETDELPRFRVNGFRQRGAISFAFRVIPR